MIGAKPVLISPIIPLVWATYTLFKNLNANMNIGRTDTRAVWHLTPCPTTTFSWKNGELFLEKEVKPVDGISGLRLSNASTCMHKHRSDSPPGRKYIRLNTALFVCRVDYPAQMSPQMSEETELLKHMLSSVSMKASAFAIFEIDRLTSPVRVAVRAWVCVCARAPAPAHATQDYYDEVETWVISAQNDLVWSRAGTSLRASCKNKTKRVKENSHHESRNWEEKRERGRCTWRAKVWLTESSWFIALLIFVCQDKSR